MRGPYSAQRRERSALNVESCFAWAFANRAHDAGVEQGTQSGTTERRQLRSRAVTAEQVCFPMPPNRTVVRHIEPHRHEIEWLITSREPARLNAAQWLLADRQYWASRVDSTNA